MRKIFYTNGGKIFFFVIPLFLFFTNYSNGQRPVAKKLTPREIAQVSLPSTVSITASNSNRSEVTSGSGFFVTEDIVATSYHVMDGSTEAFITIYGQNTRYKILSVVASDKANDLVLLKVDGAKGKPLRLNRDDLAAIGDQVFILSNPEGLEGTFSQGIVSGIRKLKAGSLLQITASISHGSSGGAVLNEKGEVIGIARGAIEAGQSLNFAVPVSILRPLISRGKSFGKQQQYIQYAIANNPLGFSFQVHPLIQNSINYYRGSGREAMEVGLYRSGMFMRMARRIFKEEGVPENIAWIGQIISAWKPNPSIWFAGMDISIPTRFGLQRTSFVDERSSFDEATRASARYLKFLANRYHGNWELAMGAYNSGESNMDRAIRRAGVENFWQALPYLPSANREFVSNCLATILIANDPNAYGFGHIRPAPSLTYDRIRVPASTNLSLIAQASDTSVEYLHYLNPHLLGNITPPEPYIINVPTGKANEVVELFRRIPASKMNNTNLANSAEGETWQNISNRTGVSVADLMAANPGMEIPRGKVFVPVKSNEQSPTPSPQIESPWLFPSQGAKCTFAKEVDACMYELGNETSLRAGFKSYGNRKVVWVLVDRKGFDEMNKMLIENGAKPLEENINLIAAVMKVAGSPPKPLEFALSPRVTELGNKVYRFNTKSGKIACVSSITDPALKNYLSYAIWICEPSELQDLTAAESSLDELKRLKIGMTRDEVVRLVHCRDGVSDEFDLLKGEKANGEKAIIRSCRIPIPKSQTNGKFRYIVFETWFVADKLFAVIPPIVKGPGGCIPDKPTSGSGVGGTKWCKEDE